MYSVELVTHKGRGVFYIRFGENVTQNNDRPHIVIELKAN